MDDHKFTPETNTLLTDTEQMYLLTTARLADAALDQPVPLSTLAQALSVQPVSANQMVHSLEIAGLLTYQPYKGVQLTPAGDALARQVLRYRVLWQRFLVGQLSLDPQEAESLACEFEHATTERAAESLETYLKTMESGTSAHFVSPIAAIPLTQLTVGKLASLSALPAKAGLTSFFQAQGLTIGTSLTVLARSADGSCVVGIPTNTIHLASSLVDQMTVTPLEHFSNSTSFP
jgi:DtxR family Mn-dependent transcriptional regulator